MEAKLSGVARGFASLDWRRLVGRQTQILRSCAANRNDARGARAPLIEGLGPGVFEDVKSAGEAVNRVDQPILVDDDMVHFGGVVRTTGWRRGDKVADLLDLRRCVRNPGDIYEAKMRTPPLKKVTTAVFFRCAEVELGKSGLKL